MKMNDKVTHYPKDFDKIMKATEQMGFDQRSDEQTGALLRTLAASKPGGEILELGTGSGLSTAWILDGMDASARLKSVEIDETLAEIARRYLGEDERVEFFVEEGEALIERLVPESIDLIFADTWPGKYHHLDETLQLLKKGGLYVIDDMLPQPNWPEGHAAKAEALIDCLESREDLSCVKLAWSTGIMICSRR